MRTKEQITDERDKMVVEVEQGWFSDKVYAETVIDTLNFVLEEGDWAPEGLNQDILDFVAFFAAGAETQE